MQYAPTYTFNQNQTYENTKSTPFNPSLLAFSCKKDPPIPEPTEPVMPPLTHQGLNTFGCYIDGELFVANEGESVWSIPPVSGSFN